MSFVLLPSAPRKATAALPFEIWSIILKLVPDPVHVWLSCRRVSSTFQNIVNDLFMRNYVPEMWITLLSGSEPKYVRKSGLVGAALKPWVYYTLDMSFDRVVGKAKHVAVFKLELLPKRIRPRGAIVGLEDWKLWVKRTLVCEQGINGRIGRAYVSRVMLTIGVLGTWGP